MAVNCCVRPSALELLAGVIASETSSAALTVKLVLADTPEPACVAVMVVLPVATVVAKPFVPAALLIVAMLVADDDHVTDPVMSCVVASVYVPVAVNCCVRPSALELFAGVRLIDTSAAEVTVKIVLAKTPEAGCVALMLVKPVLTVVARPLLPAALLIVAMLVLAEAQVTELVMFWVEPSV